jgi:hypothetical protein
MPNNEADKQNTHLPYGCYACACFPVLIGILVLGYYAIVLPLSNFHPFDYQLLAPDNKSDHLTDAEMLNLFHAHHAQLETIVKMCQADLKSHKNIAIVNYLPYHNNDLTDERVEAYNPVLRSLGIKGNGGLSAFIGEPIYVTISTSGNFETGSEKGFAFSTAKLVEINDGNGSTGSRIRFNAIDKYWYMFYSEKW